MDEILGGGDEPLGGGDEIPGGGDETPGEVPGGGDEAVRLEVRGLARRFGTIVAFEDITFTLAPGEACAVTGPNGAGKTTMLRCVVGTDRPDEGVATLDGVQLDETDPVIRSAVAAVLDDIDFFPDLSVVEHLELLAYAHGADPAPIENLLTELGLQPARDQLPATLSSGQRRRLALASALVRPCRLLVLDEPEQRLDQQGLNWLVQRLQTAKAQGTTVLFASHDRNLVLAVADSEIEIGTVPE
jgi:ABC-type multidrug transport system ATPase subunit